MFCFTFSCFHRKSTPPPPSPSPQPSSSDCSDESVESTWFEEKQGLQELNRVLEGAEKMRKRISSIAPSIALPSPAKTRERPRSSMDIRLDRESIIIVDPPPLSSSPRKSRFSVKVDRTVSQLGKRVSQRSHLSIAPPMPSVDPFHAGTSFYASSSMTTLQEESFLHLTSPSTPLFSLFPAPPSTPPWSTSAPPQQSTFSPLKRKSTIQKKPWKSNPDLRACM